MGLLKNKTAEGRIIIVGCGDLGANLAEHLSGEEVVIIDHHKGAFNKLPSLFEGREIIGDAVEIFIMNPIQIEKAAAVISATNNDNTNILVAQIAKTFSHISYIAVRLHDPAREYACQELDINTILPARITAKTISHFLYDTVKAKEAAI